MARNFIVSFQRNIHYTHSTKSISVKRNECQQFCVEFLCCFSFLFSYLYYLLSCLFTCLCELVCVCFCVLLMLPLLLLLYFFILLQQQRIIYFWPCIFGIALSKSLLYIRFGSTIFPLPDENRINTEAIIYIYFAIAATAQLNSKQHEFCYIIQGNFVYTLVLFFCHCKPKKKERTK